MHTTADGLTPAPVPFTTAPGAGHPVHHSRDGHTFVIRHCACNDELDQCIALQQSTWGSPDIEVVPRNIYVLAQALGGHVLAAWDEQGELAGFAMAVAAHQPVAGSPAVGSWMRAAAPGMSSVSGAPSLAPEPYLHSHMLAVALRYQDCGLGVALKLAQRSDALARGIGLMRWTFDPLIAKNAFFNLQRLGAVVRQYIPDFYGRLGSHLQGGLPTDRLLAEWTLDSKRTQAAIHRRLPGSRQVVARILLPSSVAVARAAGARAEVEAAQSQIRTQFEAAFAQGLTLDGFLLAPDYSGQYLLVEQGASGFPDIPCSQARDPSS